jgi:hypothetical protein
MQPRSRAGEFRACSLSMSSGKPPAELKSWSFHRVATHKPIWDKQFRAMSPLTPKPPLSDGPSTYLLYFTGRRNVLSLHIIFNLKARHNILAYLYNFAYSLVDPSYEQEVGVEDQVVLDFTLGEGNLGLSGEGPGVWAMVDKSGVLPVFRKERWDVVSHIFSFPMHRWGVPSRLT